MAPQPSNNVDFNVVVKTESGVSIVYSELWSPQRGEAV